MLCINKSCNSSAFLNLCYHVQGNGCLTTGFRSIDLNNTSLRHSAYSECYIQTKRTCRNCLYLHMRTGISKLHHRTLAILLLNMSKCRFQCFLFLFIHHICGSPFYKYMFDANLCFANLCSYFLLICYYKSPLMSRKTFRHSSSFFAFLQTKGDTIISGIPRKKAIRLLLSGTDPFYLSPISQLYISSYCFAEWFHEKSAAIARSTILFHSRLLS